MFIRNFFIFILLFFAIDIFFGNHLIKYSKNYLGSMIRVSHPFFHHTLLSDQFMVRTSWASNNYFLCTDADGFKSPCEIKEISNSNLDVVFMGDSFTEAIGVPWEDSFVGMYAKLNPQLNIANMGLAGYSPSIYYSKIKYFLDRGKKIKHVVVFVDIADIKDEGLRYSLNKDGSVSSTLHSKKKYFLINHKIKERLPFTRILYRTIINLSTPDPIYQTSWINDNNLSGYGPTGVEGAIKKTVGNMLLLSELLSANNIKLSVAIFPQPNQLLTAKMTYNPVTEKYEANKHVSIWRNFCDNRCHTFINSFPAFYEILGQEIPKKIIKEYYIDGDIHFNKKGNEIILNQIVKDFKLK